MRFLCCLSLGLPRLLSLLLLVGFVVTVGGQEAEPKTKSLPQYRIDTEGFNDSEDDIRAVCDSAFRQLWPQFADYELEPFVVTRGDRGPIVLYQRNDAKEIILRLDTGDKRWAQYSYQVSHEFCHILCGYRPGDRNNLWFEETLCETASLFVLRRMAAEWKDSPPYRNWSGYRDSLRDYADEMIGSRKLTREMYTQGLPTFYKQRAEELKKNPTNREINGAMAVVLLSLFEEQPSRWEAVRWLNSKERTAEESFGDYLERWHSAVPERHREFVRDVAELYGVELKRAAP